jgi:hypothetical protein
MVLYPDVQQKAFEEIRSVCGSDRLPSYDEDREYLPYFSATVMENLRWAPVLPLGIYICCCHPSFLIAFLIGLPHKNVTEDIYCDYYIPNGSTVFPNVW